MVVADLVDMTPVGAGTKALGTSGGAATSLIGVANLPPHAHTINHDHGNGSLGINYTSTTSTGGTALRVTDLANKTGSGGSPRRSTPASRIRRSNSAPTGPMSWRSASRRWRPRSRPPRRPSPASPPVSAPSKSGRDLHGT
ncbi:hypothetical protein GCM10027601_11010 [Nocardioides ungokensis]